MTTLALEPAFTSDKRIDTTRLEHATRGPWQPIGWRMGGSICRLEARVMRVLGTLALLLLLMVSSPALGGPGESNAGPTPAPGRTPPSQQTPDPWLLHRLSIRPTLAGVALGDSAAQVSADLGAPLSKRYTVVCDQESEYWSYHLQHGGQVELTFVGGMVTMIRAQGSSRDAVTDIFGVSIGDPIATVNKKHGKSADSHAAWEQFDLSKYVSVFYEFLGGRVSTISLNLDSGPEAHP